MKRVSRAALGLEARPQSNFFDVSVILCLSAALSHSAVVDVDGRAKDVDPFEDAPVLLQNQADQSRGFSTHSTYSKSPETVGVQRLGAHAAPCRRSNSGLSALSALSAVGGRIPP